MKGLPTAAETREFADRMGWNRRKPVAPVGREELKPDVEERQQRPLVIRVYRKKNDQQPEFKLEQFTVNSATRQVVKARANNALKLLLAIADGDPNMMLDESWQGAVTHVREIIKRYG